MTADELIERWDARDARYARRRFHGRPHPLASPEAEAIVAWRYGEASALPDGPASRTRAREVLLWWAPPEVTA